MIKKDINKTKKFKKEDKIIISNINNKKISLKKLFDKYNGELICKEFTWDKPVGKEIL